MANKRFKIIHKEKSIKVLLDLETGATYLYVSDGYGGGVTALLGSDGNPMILNPIEFDKNKKKEFEKSEKLAKQALEAKTK